MNFEYNYHRFLILEKIGDGIDTPLSIEKFQDSTTTSEMSLMMREKLIDVSKDGKYIPTDKGREFLEFMKKSLENIQKPKVKEEDLKTLELKVILSSEKPIFQSIGMGLNNGIMYIGTKVFKENQFYDAIVTSDKKMYVDWKNSNEIKEKYKLNYRYQLYHEIIDYMWSNTGKFGIYNWRFGNIEKISPKEIFEDVMKLVKWKWWTPEQKLYIHHTLSIISNYFLSCFEMKGRELIYGESGWGKTRLEKIYQLLSFNPIMSADFSDSSIYRSIESTSPTIIIDNFDTVEEEKRKKIQHIFDVGAYRKQKSVRSEGKSFRPTGFNLFSNMILNTITVLNEVSENRSNITRTLKTDKPEYTQLEEDNPIWNEIRDKLHIFALQNFSEVLKTYQELKTENKLVARELERVAPNLTIGKLVDEKIYNDMIGYYIKDNSRRKEKEWKDDYVYLAVEKIILELETHSEIEWRVKDIVENLAQEIFNLNDRNFDRKKKGLSIRLGSAFKNCILFSSRLIDGYTLYKFDRENIVQFCRMKDFPSETIEKIKQKLITDSLQPLHTTKSLNSLHSLQPLDKKDSVSSECSVSFHENLPIIPENNTLNELPKGKKPKKSAKNRGDLI